MYVPDNLDIYDYFEREQVRREWIRRRGKIEEKKEEDDKWQPYMNLPDNTNNS